MAGTNTTPNNPPVNNDPQSPETITLETAWQAVTEALGDNLINVSQHMEVIQNSVLPEEENSNYVSRETYDQTVAELNDYKKEFTKRWGESLNSPPQRINETRPQTAPGVKTGTGTNQIETVIPTKHNLNLFPGRKRG